MKPIVYIKGSEITDVRLQKFLNFFTTNSISVSYWGWSRANTKKTMQGVEVDYLLSGGGYGKKRKLFFYYILWFFVVFFKCLRANLKNKILIAIDFDSALPIYCASKLKKIDYIYEVYDDFSLRYRFPLNIKRIIHNLDIKIMNKSNYVIHVDENRVLYKGCKWIVIENTPSDFFEGKERDYNEIENKFAVIGYLSPQRGLDSILKFAIDNPNIKFLVVGNFMEKSDKDAFLSLSNVEYHDFMEQSKLYHKLKSCCAIFSLYDPSVEINRLAASNKVYDAMLFGIPVITNKEVVNSDFIKKNNLGFVIDYEYNDSWNCLTTSNLICQIREIGFKSRQLYLEKYQFDELIKHRLLPVLNNI